MVRYCVRACTADGSSHVNFNFDTLHDAYVSAQSLSKVNEHLEDKFKFHGWITCWKGYSLDDGSFVTQSEDLMVGSEF